MTSAFATLRDKGLLRSKAGDPDYRGTCPACERPMVAAVLGTRGDPVPTCHSGCAPDEMVAAIGRPTGDTRAWLTDTLDLSRDPVASAERFGRHLTAPVDLVLKSGRRIRFDEARDLTRPQVLAATVRSYTDGEACPAMCSGADAQEVLAAVLRLCGTIEADESIAEAESWMAQFLARHQVITGTLSTAGDYWRALGELRTAQYDPSVMLGAGISEPPVLLDTVSGLRYVRCADVGLFVRRRLGVSISPARLRSEMLRAGYAFVELQKWQPGTERRGSSVKLHAYVIEPLAGEVEPTADVPLYRAVPENTHTRARTPARREAGTQGYGGTEPAEVAA